MTKYLSIAILITSFLVGNAYGGDLEDAWDAYQRKDYKKAYKLWLPLAEQGFAQAQFSLGAMYDKGLGVPQDYKEAVRLFRLSAEQGDASAQFNLGLMYDNGQGVPKDMVLALMWLNLADSNGYEHAKEGRTIFEKLMTSQQIEKAKEMARNWKPSGSIRIAESPPTSAPQKITEGLKGLKRNANITGVWCGKAVDKQENCEGDEIGFLNVKQVGFGLSGEFCEAYQHDCAMIRGGEVSDKNVTFSIRFDEKLIGNFNLRLLDDNYLKGTVFSSKCNCDFPISFFRINSD